MCKNRFKRPFSTMVIALLVFILSTSAVFAGTSDSIGDSGGSGGSGSSSGGWGITSTNGTRIRWLSFPADTLSNVQLTSTLMLPGGAHPSLSVGACMKGMYVAITKTGSNTYMTWDWWTYFYGSLCGATKSPGGWGLTYSPWADIGWPSGYLPDPDLIAEANKNGYYYNASLETYTNGTEWLDAVWVTGWPGTEQDTDTTIIYSYITDTNTGSTSSIYDARGNSAEWLYNNPKTSLDYYNKTLPNEMSNNKLISASYVDVSKTETFMTDGVTKWNIVDTYAITGGSSQNKQIDYTVTKPVLTQINFMPFDLNKNGPASLADVVNTYPSFSNSVGNLNMSVNNNQNITDGQPLQALDTNSALKFNVTFNNNQFGMLTKAQGGFDLSATFPYSGYALGDGTYDNSVMAASGGVDYTMSTGRLDVDGSTVNNIAGNVSNDTYWGGGVNTTLSSSKSSLTYNGQEKLGSSESFAFLNGWTGGDFYFRTATMGAYCLYNGARNWWEVQFQLGNFFTYGLEYSGTINLSGISNPTVSSSNFYTNLDSKSTVQPLVRGDFKANTVAGNLG